MKRILSLVLLTSLISSCGFFQEAQPEPEFKAVDYTTRQQIQLKVSRVEVVSEFTPSFKRPNVEHLFPTPIEKAAKDWARERLEAVEPHSDKIATFIIKDASVVESLDPHTKAFHKDRNKYRAGLIVVLKITDSKTLSRAQTEINAWRELLIPVDTPLEEKEMYWDEMEKKLMTEFDAKMSQNINQHLNMFVKNTGYIAEY